MAEKDIDTLRTLMPELFEDRVVQTEFDGTLFVDIPSPDQPDKVDAESASIAGDWTQDRFTSLDDGFFDPELDVDLNVETTIQPLQGQFGGEFPGAPQFPRGYLPRPPTECLAFYLPYHYFHPTWWGVYLLVEGVWAVAKYIWQHSGGTSGPLTARDCWVAARLYLFYHEIFHHNVESFATRLEVSHRQPLFIHGFQTYYSAKVGTPDCLEESLAEANAYRKVCDRRFFNNPAELHAITRAVFDFIRSGPPGYAEGAGLVSNKAFNRARNRLAEESTQASIRGVPGKPPAVWDAARYMMRGFNDKAKGRAKYVIAARSPLASRMPLRPRLKPMELKRQLRKFGCHFVRQGGNHELWAAPNGRSFPIPRHPGDLGTGLIGKILKQAGIDLSLDEFGAA